MPDSTGPVPRADRTVMLVPSARLPRRSTLGRPPRRRRRSICPLFSGRRSRSRRRPAATVSPASPFARRPDGSSPGCRPGPRWPHRRLSRQRLIPMPCAAVRRAGGGRRGGPLAGSDRPGAVGRGRHGRGLVVARPRQGRPAGPHGVGARSPSSLPPAEVDQRQELLNRLRAMQVDRTWFLSLVDASPAGPVPGTQRPSALRQPRGCTAAGASGMNWRRNGWPGWNSCRFPCGAVWAASARPTGNSTSPAWSVRASLRRS